MKKIISILITMYLICALGNRLEAQISWSEVQDTTAKGYIPISDYDYPLGTYIGKWMSLQGYLTDSITWGTIPTTSYWEEVSGNLDVVDDRDIIIQNTTPFLQLRDTDDSNVYRLNLTGTSWGFVDQFFQTPFQYNVLTAQFEETTGNGFKFNSQVGVQDDDYIFNKGFIFDETYTGDYDYIGLTPDSLKIQKNADYFRLYFEDHDDSAFLGTNASWDFKETGALGINVNHANTYDIPATKGTDREVLKLDNGALGWEADDGLHTGLISGGVLTINADNTKFDLSAGSGYVLDYSVDPPDLTLVTWSASSANTVTNLATQFATDIAIDINGNIVQQQSFTREELRSHILLGGLDHSNQTNIRNIFPISNPVYGLGSNVRDLAFAIGDINIEGNVFSANGVNLKIDKSSGSVFSYGRNIQTNQNDPNVIMTAAKVQSAFNYIYDDGTGTATVGSQVTDINPNNYDDGTGTLASVGGGKYTIQRILLFPNSNNVFIQYGTEEFNNFNDAKSGFSTTSFTNLSGFKTAMTRGYLIVKTGETDLTSDDVLFIDAGTFGKTGFDTDTNMAENDLTLTALRTHEMNGFNMNFNMQNDGYFSLNQANTLVNRYDDGIGTVVESSWVSNASGGFLSTTTNHNLNLQVNSSNALRLKTDLSMRLFDYGIGSNADSDDAYVATFDASGNVQEELFTDFAMDSELHDAVTLAGQDYLTLAGQIITANKINMDDINASGTPSATTFLRGDGAWATPAGGFSDFTAGSDSGVDQTVNSGDLLDITGGNGIVGTVSKAATTVTVDMATDFTELTTETTIDGTDYVIMHDATPTANDGKITLANFISGAGLAEDSELHDAVTLAGTPDYLTLSGQQITLTTLNMDDLNATGTPNSSTFLRGDGTWATPVTTDTHLGNAALTNTQGVIASFTLNSLDLDFVGSFGNYTFNDNGKRFTIDGSTTDFVAYSATAEGTYVGTEGATDFKIVTNDDYTTPHIFLDHSTDRIGIYNTTPANALDVTGTVETDGLKIDHVTAADGLVWTATDADGNGQWEAVAGGFSDFSAGADSGVDQTINSGDLLDVVGGTGLTTSIAKVTTTVTNTINTDFGSLPVHTAMAAADNFIVHDDDLNTDKIITQANINVGDFNDDGTYALFSELHDAVTLAGQDYLTLAGQVITANKINMDDINATGTADATTYLRGDGSWQVVSGGSGLWTDGGTETYLTATGDNAVIGATAASASAKLTVEDNQTYISVKDNSTATNIDAAVQFTDSSNNVDAYVGKSAGVLSGSEAADMFVMQGTNHDLHFGTSGEITLTLDNGEHFGNQRMLTDGTDPDKTLQFFSGGTTTAKANAHEFNFDANNVSLIGKTTSPQAISFRGENVNSSADVAGMSFVGYKGGRTAYNQVLPPNHIMLEFEAQAYDGTSTNRPAGGFVFRTNGWWTNNSRPSLMEFNINGFYQTTGGGGGTAQKTMMVMKQTDTLGTYNVIMPQGYLGVGLGENDNPVQAVEVNGAINIGANDGSAEAGTIEWDGTNFRGHDGTSWVNLDAAGGGADGDGIYDGSGSTPAGVTTVTLGNDLVFSGGGADFHFDDGTGASGGYFGIDNGTVFMDLNVADAATGGEIGTSTAHSMFIKTNNSTKVVVESGGDVGIGVSNPTDKLHVDGDIIYNDYGEAKIIQTTDMTNTTEGLELVVFQTNHRDNGLLTADQANDRITVETDGDGTYRIDVTAWTDGNTNSTTPAIYLYKNGVQVATADWIPMKHEVARENVRSQSTLLDLVATDYIQVYFDNTTNSGTATLYECHLQMQKIITD